MPSHPQSEQPSPDHPDHLGHQANDLHEYHEALARDLVAAFELGDAPAIQRLNAHYERDYTHEDVRAEIWHSIYKVRQAKARPGCFALDDAREFIARHAGFGNWSAFLQANGNPPGEPFAIDEAHLSPRRYLKTRDWEKILAVMQERRITSLDGAGQ